MLATESYQSTTVVIVFRDSDAQSAPSASGPEHSKVERQEDKARSQTRRDGVPFDGSSHVVVGLSPPPGRGASGGAARQSQVQGGHNHQQDAHFKADNVGPARASKSNQFEQEKAQAGHVAQQIPPGARCSGEAVPDHLHLIVQLCSPGTRRGHEEGRGEGLAISCRRTAVAIGLC